jgi:polyisoprenoid-binding protein YceI
MTKPVMIALFAIPFSAMVFNAKTADETILVPAKNNVAEKAEQAQTKNWMLDRSHSNVKFTVTHMVVSEVDGSFGKYNGTMVTNGDDFTTAKINFTVDVASINTNNEGRDRHLKNDDFFNVEKFPEMKFESTSMKKTGDNKYELTGNLTIRDITKPVKFDVVHLGNTVDRGRTKAGFKATATIDRFDFNLKWDRVTEAGSLVVARDVKININCAWVEAPPAQNN